MNQTLFSADLRYRLTEQELLECFECLDSSKVKSRKVNGIILLCLAALFTVLFAVDTRAVNYAYLAVLLVIACLLIRFYPRHRYTHAARTAASKGGVYRIRIYDNGCIKSDDSDMIQLSSPANRFYEGETTFTLVIGKAHKFCIPKSALPEPRIAALEAYLTPLGLRHIETQEK